MNGNACSSLHSPAQRLRALSLVLALCACATSPHGRTQITSPAPISDVYSEAEMRLDLATIPSIETPCSDEECELNSAFDQQVRQLGVRIAAAAYDMHPDLIKRISRFEFEIAEKKEPGITSNASGSIVMLRGTQQIGLNEAALAFVIAREMGHVISQHHDENTTTRIVLSVAAGLLFPVLNLFGNTAALAQATSASTATSTVLATTAASSATSYFGSKLVLNSLKPDQLGEADQVALNLLERMGWNHASLAEALADSAEFEPSNAWSQEFRYSVAQVQALETASEASQPLPEIEPHDSDQNEALGPLIDPLEATPLEIAAEPSAAPPAPPSEAAIAITQPSQPADAAPVLQHTARSNAVWPKRRQAEKSKPARTGKRAKSKPEKTTAPSKKPAWAKQAVSGKKIKSHKQPAC